jgi:hypothetical protein
VTHQDGIFCANFGHQMGTFRNAIQQVSGLLRKFLARISWCIEKDEDGYDTWVSEEEDDYRGARPRITWFVLFCDACFLSTEGQRLPVEGTVATIERSVSFVE